MAGRFRPREIACGQPHTSETYCATTVCAVGDGVTCARTDAVVTSDLETLCY